MSENPASDKGPFLATAACTMVLVSKGWSTIRLRSFLDRAEDRAHLRSYTYRSVRVESAFVTLRISRRTPFLRPSRNILKKTIIYRWSELRNRRNDQRLLLRHFDRKFHYVETAKGYAELVIFGTILPEALCASLGGGHRRLSEVLEDKRFFSAGDPYVISVKNGVRDHHQALILRLKLEFKDYRFRKTGPFG